MSKSQFLIIVLCVGFLGYVAYLNQASLLNFFIGEDRYAIQIGGSRFYVTVADSQEERIQGLSGTPSIGEREGKLFVFDRSDFHGIWMKDMNFPIDILWVDEDERVVHIEESVQPDTYPQTFRPREPARYVIELHANAVQEHRINKGQTVILPKNYQADHLLE